MHILAQTLFLIVSSKEETRQLKLASNKSQLYYFYFLFLISQKIQRIKNKIYSIKSNKLKILLSINKDNIYVIKETHKYITVMNLEFMF